MFKALSYFTDLQDNGYAYHTGDNYPRKGYEPTKERIEELSTGKNVRGVPVIVEIATKAPTEAANDARGTIAPEDCINPPTEADNDDSEVKETKPKTKARKVKKNA